MKLTNNHTRTLGVPGSKESIIIDSGRSVEITEDDLKAIYANTTASLWVDQGLIAIEGAPEQSKIIGEIVVDPNNSDFVDVIAPFGVIIEEQESAIVKHVGGGRWNVFVNDEPLSEETLDKEEAEALAVEYNAPSN